MNGARSSVGLPFLLPRRDASQLVEEIEDERKVVMPDGLAFGKGSYCDPHAIRVQSVDALNEQFAECWGALRPEARFAGAERLVLHPVRRDHEYVAVMKCRGGKHQLRARARP